MPDRAEQIDRLKAALADGYRLERELGAGGMATVYLAQDLKHERKVALKVLRPELAAVIGAERFLTEIKTTANLQHPHILPLFDSGQVDSFLFYVMPYVEGESLRDRLTREKQLSIADAVKIASEVASALDYAHRQGVIHRDIKPENILLHDGRVLVADFGIALAVSSAGATRLTETGMSLGTPHYMSPEQAMGEREITARSDIYALGCVLYEMLLGGPPFTGPSAQAIVAQVVTAQPRPLRAQRHTVPHQIEAAVLTALEKLPADRFPTAAEFADVLEGRRQIAAPTGPIRSTGMRPFRSVLPIAAAGAAAGALLATVIVLVANREAPERVEHWTIASLPYVDTIPINQVLDISPDGTQLVSVVADPAGQRLEVRALERPVGTPLPGTENARWPRFSPDAARVAFLAPPGVVKWVSVEGGTPQILAEAGSWGLCWGEDGYIYFPRPATDSLPEGISRVQERGGQPVVLTTIDSTRGEYTHSCAQVLPAGRGLLYVNVRAGGIETAELMAYSFETGQSEMVLHVPFGQVAQIGHLVYVTNDRVLTAAPLDEKTLKVTGPPVSLASNVFINDDVTAFALSGTGTLLYGEMQPRQSRLAWVDRAGVATGIDESLPQEFTAFALSADGRRIAAEIIRDGVPALWVYAFPLGPWTRLGSAASSVVARRDRPAWDPSGTRITFIAPGTSGLVTAWSIPVDGQGPPQELRRVTSIPIQDGEFSPDGQWFVYRQGPVGPRQRDIFYARPDPDSVAYELAVTDADEFAPTLSADGRWLAYVSDASGREEIVVQPFPGPGRRTQVSFDGGLEPRWAHSGRELFYRDGAGNLVVVEVRAGADFSVGARRILFSATGYLNDRNATLYEVAADDQRFLFIQPVSGGDVSWKLVRGFLSELEAKVGK